LGVKYQIAVYFDGPRSQWGEKLDASECIFIGESPWLWFARQIARGHLGNTGRCSYVISSGDKPVEEFKVKPQDDIGTATQSSESHILDATRPGGLV
jgi:hypothetical protein